MKYLKLLLFSILILILIPNSFGLRGVGLQYGTTAQIVPQGKTTCVPYGVYNPWDEDVYILLTTSGELSNFTTTSDSVFVPAKTFHDKSLPIQICFNIPKVYKPDCIAFVACEQTCPTELREYNGLILATEDKKHSTITGTGSATSVSASSPLKLIVSCEESERNWIPLAALIGGIVLAIIVILRVWMIMRVPARFKRNRR